jgi:CHAD domain-containing protein
MSHPAHRGGTRDDAMTTSRRSSERILQSTLERWRRDLAQPGSTSQRVHAARVVLKEARAVVRLYRGISPDFDAEEWNERLRDAMKALAPARDQTVMRGVLREHARQLRKEADRAVVTDALPPPAHPGSRALRQVPSLLEECGQALRPVARACGWAPVDEAFDRALRQVRRLQKRAGRDEEPEVWHRWRRRVKALAYQADFVQPPHRATWKPLREAAWQLQANLGLVQDLNITRALLDSLEIPSAIKKSLRPILRRAADTAMRVAWKARISKRLLRD